MSTRTHLSVKLWRLLAVFPVFLSACMPVASQTPSTTVTLTQVNTWLSWLQIYFTDPSGPRTAEYAGGPDEALAADIDRARLSVDVAAYSFNLWSIRDAVIDARHRGVVVRMVMESDNMDDNEVQDLLDAGIPIVGDQHEGLMHDKFIIIDRTEVWTGSMNFTTGGAYKDNNNLIRIHSSKVAGDYTARFEAMFKDRRFGPYAESNTPFPILTIEGTLVEVYFSPADGVSRRIVELLHGARKSIFFLAYSFTSNDLGDAILERAQAGVEVFGVMDAGQIDSNQGTEYDKFIQAGLFVRKDGNEGLMHDKVIIIDQRIVITGSYNFSNSAENTNDENLVIIFDPGIAARYLAEFQRILNQSQP